MVGELGDFAKLIGVAGGAGNIGGVAEGFGAAPADVVAAANREK